MTPYKQGTCLRRSRIEQNQEHRSPVPSTQLAASRVPLGWFSSAVIDPHVRGTSTGEIELVEYHRQGMTEGCARPLHSEPLKGGLMDITR